MSQGEKGSPAELVDSFRPVKRSTIACLHCRAAKLKCSWAQTHEEAKAAGIWADGDEPLKCSRCVRLKHQDCVVVLAQKGRKQGSKNRPKAERLAEQEARAARAAAKRASGAIVELLKPVVQSRRESASPQPVSPVAGPSSVATFPPATLSLPQRIPENASPAVSSEDNSSSPSLVFSAPHPAESTSRSSVLTASPGEHVWPPSPGEHYEMPMQPLPARPVIQTPQLPAESSTLARLNFRVPQAALQEGLDLLLQQQPVPGRQRIDSDAFLPRRQARADVDDGLDPVEIGLLTEDHLARLFVHFFSPHGAHEAAPTLDPDLHVPDYVRQRSAFLTSTVALLAAQNLGGQAQLAYQLSQHVRHLRRQVLDQSYKSLEICQALHLYSVWPRTDAEEPEDQTLALAQALAIALDMRLDRLVEDEDHLPPAGNVMAVREKRNRERMLLTLYIWDRAAAVAEGRRLTLGLPDDFIVPWLDRWAAHPLASACDAMLLQHAALRYEASIVRKAAERELATPSSSRAPSVLTDLVREKIGQWLQHFQSSIAPYTMPQRHMAHLLIIYHTIRASLLSFGLPQSNYLQSIGDSSGDALVAETRLACLDACETVLLQCNVLLQLPANISLAVVNCAMQALKLHQTNGSVADLAPLIGLLAQVAQFLEMSGTVPPHRAGPNVKYGRHLFAVLRAAAEPMFAPHPPIVEQSPVPPYHDFSAMTAWQPIYQATPSDQHARAVSADWQQTWQLI